MDCLDARELMHELLDNEPGPERDFVRAEVEEHVGHCPSCGQEEEELQEVDARLREALTIVPAPTGLVAAALERVEVEPGREAFGTPRICVGTARRTIDGKDRLRLPEPKRMCLMIGLGGTGDKVVESIGARLAARPPALGVSFVFDDAEPLDDDGKQTKVEPLYPGQFLSSRQSLFGLAGMGKTTLAAAVARAVGLFGPFDARRDRREEAETVACEALRHALRMPGKKRPPEFIGAPEASWLACETLRYGLRIRMPEKERLPELVEAAEARLLAGEDVWVAAEGLGEKAAGALLRALHYLRRRIARRSARLGKPRLARAGGVGRLMAALGLRRHPSDRSLWQYFDCWLGEPQVESRGYPSFGIAQFFYPPTETEAVLDRHEFLRHTARVVAGVHPLVIRHLLQQPPEKPIEAATAPFPDVLDELAEHGVLRWVGPYTWAWSSGLHRVAVEQAHARTYLAEVPWLAAGQDVRPATCPYAEARNLLASEDCELGLDGVRGIVRVSGRVRPELSTDRPAGRVLFDLVDQALRGAPLGPDQGQQPSPSTVSAAMPVIRQALGEIGDRLIARAPGGGYRATPAGVRLLYVEPLGASSLTPEDG